MFSSITTDNPPRSPHDLYETLALDAAFNRLGPDLDDDEQDRITEAVCTAVATVLHIAQLPDDWSEFVRRTMGATTPTVRNELQDVFWEKLPPITDYEIQEAGAAIAAIRKAASTGNDRALHHAVLDLETAMIGRTCTLINQAFVLGWEYRADPSLLVFAG